MQESIRDRAIAAAKRYLPRGVRDLAVRVQRALHLQWPPSGTVRFGSFRRLTPISPVFALDRGFPIERYYIGKFLGRHSEDIRGRALEFGETRYLDEFGGGDVDRKEVFSYVEEPDATIVGDLTEPDSLPERAFDCIVCTQTVQMVYDIHTAVRSLHAMLRPGGVLLLTTHGISKIGRHLDTDDWGEYWHLTVQGARSLFTDGFEGEFEVDSYGNVFTAMCALHGLASEELTEDELDHRDRDYPVLVTVRAVRG